MFIEPNVTTPCVDRDECSSFSQCVEEAFPCSNSYITQFLQPFCNLSSFNELADWTSDASDCLIDKVKEFLTNNYTAFPSSSDCLNLQTFMFGAQAECINKSLCTTSMGVNAAQAVADVWNNTAYLRDRSLEQLLDIARSCSGDQLDNLISSLQDTGYIYCVQLVLEDGGSEVTAIADFKLRLLQQISALSGDSNLTRIDSARCPQIPSSNRKRRNVDEEQSLLSLTRSRRNAHSNSSVTVAFLNTGAGAISKSSVCENTSSVGDGNLLCPVCGDGIFDAATEACDDGNMNDGDGCSRNCTIEPDFDCNTNTAPSVCYSHVCGDSIRVSGEECDNGDGAGCSSVTCLVFAGFECVAPFFEASNCFSCGNGRVEELEDCDNGPSLHIDGCSNDCKVNPLWRCTRVVGEASVCVHVAVDFNSADDTTLDPPPIIFETVPITFFIVENPALLDASLFGDEASGRLPFSLFVCIWFCFSIFWACVCCLCVREWVYGCSCVCIW